MANTLLIAAAAGAVAYFGFYKPKQDKKKRAQEEANEPPLKPRILFNELCHWEIPDAWWTDVGHHKFAAILENNLAGATTWDEKKAKLLEKGTFPGPLNSRVMAHTILEGETTPACPLPAVDSDIYNPPPTLTEQQTMMNNLFAHMVSHVEASGLVFIGSQGTRVEFPVPLDVPEGG